MFLLFFFCQEVVDYVRRQSALVELMASIGESYRHKGAVVSSLLSDVMIVDSLKVVVVDYAENTFHTLCFALFIPFGESIFCLLFSLPYLNIFIGFQVFFFKQILSMSWLI